MSLRNGLLLFLLAWIFQYCASQKPPTGGPKDEAPPVLTHSFPKEGSTLFRGKQIRLSFDEHIDVKNLRQELIITPHPDLKYKEKIRAKSLIINIKDTLKPNTTYSLNFGNAVYDVTEKNVPENLSLAFSTGSFLDSGIISGRVWDGFTKKPANEKTMVGLYPASYDSISDPRFVKPDYLAKCDKRGVFSFKNLPAKEFRLLAIQDKNQNRKFEQGVENLGMHKDFVHPFLQKDSVNLELYPQDHKPPKLVRITHGPDHTKVSFSKGIESLETDKQTAPILWKNAGKDLVIFYQSIDSQEVRIIFSDSLRNQSDSLIVLKIDSSGRSFDEPLKISLQPQKGIKLDPGQQVGFIANTPVRQHSNDSLRLILSRDTSYIRGDTIVMVGPRLFQFKPPGNSENFRLEIPKGFWTDYRSDSSEALQLSFSYKKAEEYGQVEGRVETSQPCFQVQLLNHQFEIAGHSASKKFTFKGLDPGQYFLRALIDENCNARWDQGNLETNQLPERFYFLQESIQLKANWIQQDKVLKFE